MNEKLSQIKELLLKRRNEEKANLESSEDFNPCDASGGNFDDAFSLGKDCGEAELIEELLTFIG